jgi:hypothetical protein
MNYIKTLVVKFSNEIGNREIIPFRGAVIASMDECDILFHNHKEEGYRYAYPLIQYKRIQKQATIICFGEGTDKIADFFTSKPLSLRINDKVEDVIVENLKAERTLIQTWNSPINYKLKSWLPLNGDNYKKYISTESLIERMQILEDILKGNILSALKGLGIHIEETIECHITYLSDAKMVKFKNVKLMSFDIDFNSNISLPQYLGLGKHCSVGFGTLYNKRNKHQ